MACPLVVVLGHAGVVSLEALRWQHDLGAAFVQLGADGEAIACFAPSGRDAPRLRQAQALAPERGTRIALVWGLLAAKLRGQAALLPRLPGGEIARPMLEQALSDLERAETTQSLRLVEATGAKAYWGAWAGLPVPFVRNDVPKVPNHRLAFTARSSPLSGSPRNAADPANAVLNYLYALLEAEARIACLAVGLDPGLGVLHADQRGRDSVALDLMEAVRPSVDAYVLDLLHSRVSSRDDVFETRQGSCRLLPPLAERLAETTRAWGRAVGSWSERAETLLLAGEPIGAAPTLPTALTGANRRAARGLTPQLAIVQAGKPPAACRGCGAELADARRRYCAGSLPEARERSIEDLALAGPTELARLRAEGIDPSHGGEAGRERGKRNAEHVTANAAKLLRIPVRSVLCLAGSIRCGMPGVPHAELLLGIRSLSWVKFFRSQLDELGCRDVRPSAGGPWRLRWRTSPRSPGRRSRGRCRRPRAPRVRRSGQGYLWATRVSPTVQLLNDVPPVDSWYALPGKPKTGRNPPRPRVGYPSAPLKGSDGDLFSFDGQAAVQREDGALPARDASPTDATGGTA